MLNQEAISSLKSLLADRFAMDNQTLIVHSYDATPMYQAVPDGVVYPFTTQEVQEIMRIATKHQIPIVSRGSGSNLAASTVPVQGGIVMNMTRMNCLLEIDEDNLTATVQPGLVTKQFIEAVEAKGLFYPPDPGSMVVSTLGGNIAQCAGGLHGLKYGTTKDYVLGLEAVLPNGEVIRTGGKLTKDVAGYDLTKLLVGSEGTLAIITEATLKLLPKPEMRRVMVAHFDEIDAAAQTVSEIIKNRIIPCTLEFLDQGTMEVVEDFVKIGLPKEKEAILLMQQDGPDELVNQDIEKMAEICRRMGAAHVQIAQSDEEGTQLLTARRFALSALARSMPTTILEDATVPRAAIAPMVRRVREIAQKYQLRICTFGHAGDGNLHPTCMTDARNEEEIQRVEKAFEEIFEAALELGGTITGEHGVGMAKAPYLEWKVGAAGMEVLRGIKKAFDPDNLLNPDKMFAKETRPRVVVTCPKP
ncbi:FAD-binding oxidoreductase [Risungbinella massiliensis]|uniref:FAD-binding oxidoreductase n=1 Tax=Risungbinella massiliensis TaxID=1329796 RepID=UPI0005CC1F09